MEKFNKTTKVILGIAVAILIWISGIVIGQEQTVLILSPEGGIRGIINQTKIIKVNLMLDYGGGQIKVYPEMKLNYGDSILKLIEAADRLENNKLDIHYQEDSLTGGISALSINGYQSLPNNKEWLVWLDNNLQVDDLNKIKLKSGDIVELKYIKLQPPD